MTMLASAAPVFAGDGISVKVKYAGTGYDTTIEMIEDGFPVNLTYARGKGTFGNSTIAITAEFVYDERVLALCPEGYVLPLAVVPTLRNALTISRNT